MHLRYMYLQKKNPNQAKSSTVDVHEPYYQLNYFKSYFDKT